MKKYIEIEHRKDWTYANWIKIRPYIMQKYSKEYLEAKRLKEKARQHKYYIEVTKPNRKKKKLSLN